MNIYKDVDTEKKQSEDDDVMDAQDIAEFMDWRWSFSQLQLTNVQCRIKFDKRFGHNLLLNPLLYSFAK